MNVKQYIKECVQEEMMRNAVRSIISEELHRMWRNGELNESLFEKDDDDEKDSDRDDSKEKDKGLSQLNNVLDRNPIIKKSKLAYVLHPDVSKNSARHIFNDQLDGEDPISLKDVNHALDIVHNAGIG